MNSDSQLALSGKTIVVTRSQDQQAEARSLFEERGAKVLDLPALVIGPPFEWSPLDDALIELDSFHWIIFSSVNGVKAVDQRLQLIGSALASRPKTLKIAAIGRKTSSSLKSLNVTPDFVPPQFVADSLIKHFPVSGYGLKILIPRVQTGGRTILAESFGKAGATVVEVPAYESQCPNDIPIETLNAFTNKMVDAIVFTSGKTAVNTAYLIKKYFGVEWKKFLSGVKIISIGPQTSITCKENFNKVDQEASQHDLDGLIDACIQSMKINSQQ